MRRALTLLCIFALGLTTQAAKAGDPYLRWYTVKTPHFHVHYHGGLEQFAQRVASVAEQVHGVLAPAMNWQPTQVTQVLLTDDSSGANGSANSTPYNTVRMYVTAPDDMSALNDYDDWAYSLMMHEHTHVLHLDNVHGLPAVLNAIFGKTYMPNQNQPRWIIEGLATVLESRKSSGGRLRSSQFDMFMRADVLEGQMLTLDQFTHPVRRFPGGSIFYLYGSRFIDWIMDTYGPDTFAAVSTDYGQNLIPWGINRSIRRATGRTYPELYQGWKRALERRYSAQRDAVVRRGRREGARLTSHGFTAAYPRFTPTCGGAATAPSLVYYRDDGHSSDALVRLTLDADRRRVTQTEVVTRSQQTQVTFDADCGLVFSSTAPSARRYYFWDLFRQAADTTTPHGLGSGRLRLTQGLRARSPDISPDGRRIVYVRDRAGTTTLRIAEYGSDYGVDRERLLVNMRRYEQVFTPRFSPDGKRVAYSTWLTGGFRDVHIVDVETGQVTAVTHDRAIDQQPSWSPDGHALFFTSDRTGIANVYAYSLVSGELAQVTNVVSGAYMPTISPDGRHLVYVGYTSLGYDLYSLELDADEFLPALPYVDDRPLVMATAQARTWPVEPYSVLPTLRPYSYELEFDEGPFGDQLTLSTSGQDITARHAFAASVGIDFEEYQPQLSSSYLYTGMPIDLSVAAFRSVLPRNYTVDERTSVIRESVTGLGSGVGYGVPGEFASHYLAMSYSVNVFDQRLPVAEFADPYAPVPQEPHSGQLGLVHLGYQYARVEGSAYGISYEHGIMFDVGVDYASEVTISDDSLLAVNGRLRTYAELPWLRHHVFALALGGGAAGGTYPRQGFYSVGGYQDLPILDAYTSELRQSGFRLRGYEPSQFVGRHYVLANAEYRFPISYVERGLSTLPVFLQTLSGNVFADYGGAFDRFNVEDRSSNLHLGVGAELWLDLILGYSTSNTLRAGMARGFGPENQGVVTYFVASSRF
ncbi:MAG TPA: BamA/TamA family outer membrane protein [Polyangiaceae bacterium]